MEAIPSNAPISPIHIVNNNRLGPALASPSSAASSSSSSSSASQALGSFINPPWPSLPVPLPVPVPVPSSSRCTRQGCERVCESGREVCEGCAAGSSTSARQGNAIPSTSMVKPPTKMLVNCTSCRIPLEVPSQYQASYILCPPCQSRNAAFSVKANNYVIGNGNGHERPVPRANPYPVIHPVATTSSIPSFAVAFSYSHLPVSSASSSSLSSSTAPAPAPTPAPLRDANTNTNTNATDRISIATLRRGADMLRVCMRFGCGARLPPHITGNMCETCTGAGFTRPPPAPPMVVPPKRVPRRAKERTYPLPRESLDLVRASLLREAAEKAKDASVAGAGERKDEDEMDVDLVYPEDVPESGPSTAAISESRNGGPKRAQNEKNMDVDLELMYPEDTEKAARKPPATSRIQPNSLRELVKSGLKIIPTLDDENVQADDRPKRQCQTPGCNEILPTHICMQRCVKCCLTAWKERKKAAIEGDRVALSRRPSAISMTSSADSAEAREVVAMLEETSDGEEEEQDPLGAELPPTSSSPSKGSETERYIPGWDSDLTDLTDSDDSDSDSNSNSDSSDNESGPEVGLEVESYDKPHDRSSLRIRIPLLVYRLPSHVSLRKCSSKRCNIALPNNYQWKRCAACRRSHNEYQKMRYRKLRNMLGLDPLKVPDFSNPRWRSLSPDPDGEVSESTLTLENSRPCSVKHCRTRIPLPEIYKWKTCVRCRARSRHEARRKRDALIASVNANANANANASQSNEVVPRFQAYQHRNAMMGAFEGQLRGFVEGQILFLRAKMVEWGWSGGTGAGAGAGVGSGGSGSGSAGGSGSGVSWKPERIPMAFKFSGEYSIITGSRDSPPKTLDRNRNGNGDGGGGGEGEEHPQTQTSSPNLHTVEAMRKEVWIMVQDLERVLQTKFKSGEAFAIDSGGIIMRFTCSLELLAQLRPLHPGSGADSRAGGERMDVDKVAEMSKSGSTNQDSKATISESKATPSESKATTGKPEAASDDSKATNPPTVPLVKTLSGELEAVIVPDESHRFFHGRRTVVRFCMVG